MKCKSCGKTIEILNFGLAYKAKAPCKCGRIRTRERLKGCTKCDAHGFDIQIKKHWYGWLLYCKCGHKWRVRK